MGKVVLTGKIVEDASINSVSDTQDVVNFTLATNESYKVGDEWKERTEFNNCARFVPKGKGDKLASKLTKGRHMEIRGDVQTGKAKAAKDGVMHVNHGIRVNELEFGALPKAKEAAAE